MNTGVQNTQTLSESIASAGKELILSQPFYGNLLLSINKLVAADKYEVPTMGVTVEGINSVMIVNPDFWWNSLPLKKHRQALMMHELMHLAMFHPQNRSMYDDQKLANIAMDLEINQYIPRDWFPDNGMSKEEFDIIIKNATEKAKKLKPKLDAGEITKEEFFDLIGNVPARPLVLEEYGFNPVSEAHKGTKYYYDKLKQQIGTGKNPALDSLMEAQQQDVPTVCDHQSWEAVEKLSDEAKSLTETQVEHLLKQSYEQVQKSRGTIPGELRERLENLMNPTLPVIDWRSYFRLFAGSSNKTYVHKTRRRPSFRHPDSPKVIIKSQRHVLFGIDTSGSMSNRELEECFHELAHVCKTGVQVTVLECDTKLGRMYPFSKLGDQGTEISGGGGTTFDPVIDYFNDNLDKYTTLVYFTDGYAPPPRNPSKIPMLWVLSSGGAGKSVESLKNDGFEGNIVKMVNDWD